MSGLPGGIGLRGPPVSDYSLYLYCMDACSLHTTLNQRLPVPPPSCLLPVPSLFLCTLSSLFLGTPTSLTWWALAEAQAESHP